MAEATPTEVPMAASHYQVKKTTVQTAPTQTSASIPPLKSSHSPVSPTPATPTSTPTSATGSANTQPDLMSFTPLQVTEKYQRGEIDDAQASDYIVLRKIKTDENGIYSLTPDEVTHGYTRGLIPEAQAASYIEFKQKHNGESAGGFVKTTLDVAGFVLRPLSTLQAGAIAPFAHKYDSTTSVGQAIEALQVSGKAMKDALLPTYGVTPNYEKQVIENYLPNIPESLKPGAELALGLITDPAILAFPFAKSIRAGLEVAAMSKTESGVFRHALEEMVSLVPMKHEDIVVSTKLAREADLGSKKATNELVEKWKILGKVEESAKSPDVFKETRGGGTQYHGTSDELRILQKTEGKGVLKAETPKTTQDTTGKLAKSLDKVSPEANKTLAEKIFKTATTSNGELELDSKFLNILADDAVEPLDLIKAVDEHTESVFTKTRNGDVLTHEAMDKATEKNLLDSMKEQAKILGSKFNENDARKNIANSTRADVEKLTIRAQTTNKLFIDAATQTDELVKLARSVDGTFSDKLRAIEHIQYLAELQSAAVGIRAEAGRMLQSYRTPWSKSRFDFSKLTEAEIDAIKAGDGDRLEAALKAFSEAGTPIEKLRNANMLGRNPWLMGLLEAKQASLLWHYKTQVVNLIGNGLSASTYLFNKVVGNTAYALLRGDSKHFDEIKYIGAGIQDALIHTFGSPKSANKDIKVAGEVISKERPDKDVGRFYTALKTGIAQIDSTTKATAQETSVLRDKFGTLGKLWTLPFNGLTATDEMFKNFSFYTELYSSTYRKAVANGLEGKDIHGYVQATMDSISGKAVTADMMKESQDLFYKALDASRYNTFTSKLGATGNLKKLLNSPAFFGIRLTTIPFFDVLVNITKYSAQSTPLGILSKHQREIMKAGGPEAAELMTRWATGTALLTLGGVLHHNRVITGRIDPKNRDMYNNAGVPQYAINTEKMGGKSGWVEYGRLDPISTIIGWGADLAAFGEKAYEYGYENDDKHIKDFSEVVSSMILAIGGQIQDKTFAKGIKETMQLVTEPDKMNLGKWSGNQLASFIPRAFDMGHELLGDSKAIREVNDFFDPFFSKFYPEGLPTKRHNIYGTPINKDPAYLGILNRRYSNDPVTHYLLKEGINIDAPSRSMSMADVNIELSDEQYQKYNDILESMNIKGELEQVIADPEFRSSPSVIQGEQIKSLVLAMREAAKGELFGVDNSVDQDFIEKYKDLMMNHTGQKAETSRKKRDKLLVN